MTETTIASPLPILDGFPPIAASACQPSDWHDVPKGFYAMPVWDWERFTDEIGMDKNDPAPVAELLGFLLFERKIPRMFKTGKRSGQRAGQDQLTTGHRVLAQDVAEYSIWPGTDHEVRFTSSDRLKSEIDSDRHLIEHEYIFDGDLSRPCRCPSCLDRNDDGRWKAAPNQAEAYRNSVATMFLDGIKKHDDIYRKLYGQITGNCGMCGTVLTDPTSKLLGIGPDCRGYR